MNRKLAILGLVLLAGIFMAVQTGAQDDVNGDFPLYDGIWDTDLGILALWQANDAVFGIYGSYAEIGGHINEDGILHFTYDNDPNDMGSGWFEISSDGTAFDGMYTSTMDTSIGGTWDGTRLGPNEFDVNDREALNYQPGDTPPDYSEGGEGEEEASDDSEAEDEDLPEESEEFSGDVASAWSGSWDTNRGQLVLTVEEGSVSGSFGDGCNFEGTITGTTINGVWSMTDDEGNETSGEVLFNLSEDGMSFRGTYNSTEEPDLWLAWHGTKV